MFKGFYTVATGMVAQQRKTEILTNNMANANTPGFKSDQTTIRSFPDMLMSAVGSTNIPTENGFALKRLDTVGALNAGVYLQETMPDQAQGQIYSTGLTTDVALINSQVPTDVASGNSGQIFFRLENENGTESYTRNGNFTLDGAGNLVNPMGLFVLDANGNRMQFANDNIRIDSTGAIFDENNVQVGVLGVAFSANPDVLVKRGNGLYNTLDGADLPSAYGQDGVQFSMQQQYLEGSNVDASKAMTDLLTAYRAFEANQKVLQAYDKSMDKAVNEIGRV
ncbi:flagellar hook-basal body protein [Solibacillus sp. MA9]|uniref:Flagellar hook-basal body protein n=1 Tax=Solibacillus palustris TaxID=2908203 RepID=A0ABS9U8C2_9BACL|nr:flagellar hook-basal body protein [Solibacillus sp. MA9]MCH7320581.1 flagellar hook-basal body protein [Solibacillus sp. MA9]